MTGRERSLGGRGARLGASPPPAPAGVPDGRRGAWVPRVTLVMALLLAVALPSAHHLGQLAPTLIGVAIVLLGAVGFFWSMALRELGMALANVVVGVFAVPAVVALVTVVGGP